VVIYHAMPEDAPSRKPWLPALILEQAKPWIGLVIAVVADVLLHPFDWLTAAIAILITLGSVLMALIARRRRRAGRSPRLLHLGAALLGCTLLVWLASSPFVVGTTPLYVCDSSGNDPTGTFVEPLIVNGRRVASLLFVADPVRKSAVFKAVARQLGGKRLHEIKRLIVAGNRYYEIPLGASVRKVAPTASASTDTIENIKIIYDGFQAAIDMRVDGTFELAIGPVHSPIVNWVGLTSRPWSAVPLQGSTEQDTFRYVARLDRGLMAVEEGDHSTALALLEDAGLHAPNMVERARTLA